MDRNELKEKLLKIGDLATLPVVAYNVMQLTQNPKSSAMDVGKAISQDPALTSKVLKIANSSFYGFPRKISTINNAIVLLGFSNIRNIVLSAGIIDAYKGEKSSDFFDRTEFWKHSLACGIASKIIASTVGLKNSEEAFIWGLLHDIGKIVMDTYIHQEFSQVSYLAKAKGMLLVDAEQKYLGFNHTTVGSLVAEKWNMPPALLKVIRYHHNPAQDYNSLRISSIVHLADILCRTLDLGSGGDDEMPVVNEKSWDLMNLDKRMIKKIFSEIEEEYESATAFL
ncbi:MAG: HDOD domain-containing protein [Desulfobacteraceae bacterium]|nr:HDOD domain-containing protein [Desulfobacteraceae bacterium]